MSRILAILLLLALLTAAAFFWSLRSHAPADFVFISRGEVRSLDPGRMSWLEDIRLGYALWEGLYTFDPQTLRPIPGAAQRIDISPDRLLYTFHLRPEARWSNGDPVTSRDFLFAWRRMLEQPGVYSYLFDVIAGAADYRRALAARQPADFAAVAIEAPDPSTLRVRLKYPVPYFPDLCAFAPFWPLHEPSMKPFWDEATHSYRAAFTQPPHLISNGPFRLTRWEYRTGLRMEASPFYWDRKNVRSRSVEMLPADDATWAFLKYESKTADWVPDAAGSVGSELYAKQRPDLHVFPAMGTYYYSLNCRERLPGGAPNPLRDPRVRKALALAIDRRPIVQSITRLGERTASHYIPPGVFEGYISPQTPETDIPAAQRLLAAAGYPAGRGFPSLSVLFNAEFQHGEIAQIVCRQWQQNLGITVQPEQVDVKMFGARLRQGDFAIARTTWYADYSDPTTFLDKYRSDASNNQPGWANSDYDALLNRAQLEPDPEKRLRLLESAEAVLLQDQPIIPLYHAVHVTLFRPGTEGISLNPRYITLMKYVAAGRN